MLVKPTAQSVPNTGAHRTDTFKPLYKKTQCLLDRVFRDRFRNVCGDVCWAVANKGQCAVGQIRHSRLPAAELNVVPPRGARGQAEVSEDPDNDRGIRDGGDDFQAAAAVWTVLNVDLEDALEQARPTDAGWRRAVCSVSVIIARVTGVAIRRAPHDGRTRAACTRTPPASHGHTPRSSRSPSWCSSGGGCWQKSHGSPWWGVVICRRNGATRFSA